MSKSHQLGTFLSECGTNRVFVINLEVDPYAGWAVFDFVHDGGKVITHRGAQCGRREVRKFRYVFGFKVGEHSGTGRGKARGEFDNLQSHGRQTRAAPFDAADVFFNERASGEVA